MTVVVRLFPALKLIRQRRFASKAMDYSGVAREFKARAAVFKRRLQALTPSFCSFSASACAQAKALAQAH